MGVLPVALFASGHTYFVQRLHERMGLDVYAVHATFQFSGTPGKRHRLRERQLWLAVRLAFFPPVLASEIRSPEKLFLFDALIARCSEWIFQDFCKVGCCARENPSSLPWLSFQPLWA